MISVSWIQQAVKNPGALTQWFMRNRKRLKRKLGYDPISRKGGIKDRAVNDVLRLYRQGRIRLSRKTLRRLYLARTLQKLRRRR